MQRLVTFDDITDAKIADADVARYTVLIDGPGGEETFTLDLSPWTYPWLKDLLGGKLAGKVTTVKPVKAVKGAVKQVKHSDSAQRRAWWKTHEVNGFTYSDKGKIPKAVHDAYEAELNAA